ncbi:MAG: hypothetical protein GY940_07665, partial [bacterium]|nr:hypothetical protein [bacterium]
SGGPIQAGDLLTSSATAGYAGKVSITTPGTLLGKALMQFPPDGSTATTGVIPVLVNIH